MNLIYGPVNSIRYGMTMGVNILGNVKVCSYDCLYCALGPSEMTMNKIRKEYVFPTVEEVQQAFRDNVKSQHPYRRIVVSGNGEPTLHGEFDEMMKMLMQLRDEHYRGMPVTVLSNGAHLDLKHVVTGLNLVDERVIKLDAGTDQILQKVNAPLVRINVSRLLGHLPKLKDVTIQAMFVGGAAANTNTEFVDEWIEIVGMVKPLAVQIQTISRAPMNPGVTAVDDDTLYSIAFKLKKRTGLEAQVFTVQKT